MRVLMYSRLHKQFVFKSSGFLLCPFNTNTQICVVVPQSKTMFFQVMPTRYSVSVPTFIFSSLPGTNSSKLSLTLQNLKHCKKSHTVVSSEPVRSAPWEMNSPVKIARASSMFHCRALLNDCCTSHNYSALPKGFLFSTIPPCSMLLYCQVSGHSVLP